MIVRAVGLLTPFIDRATLSGSADRHFGNEVIGDQPMLIRTSAKQRQATGISERSGQSRMNKRFPEIRIVAEVPHQSLVRRLRDEPVEADPIAPGPVVLGHGPAGRTDPNTPRWHQYCRMD
jgi:hypothetical protein